MNCASFSPETYASLIGEFETELLSIAQWWIENTLDTVNGGFVGEIDSEGVVSRQANKGGILNARILWFFSEAARYTGNEEFKRFADVAYDYLTTCFWDKEYDGVYWELDCRGEVVNHKKHIYAQSFAIYALCAYYRLGGDGDALAKALKIYERIEISAYDSVNGGYREAFNRAWEETDDVALSEGEPDFPRSMNTHLHLFEAFTALYAVCPRDDVKTTLKRLLDCFTLNFINPENFHLRMYLDRVWRDRSTSHSYGHDIECSWLLWESVEAIGDEKLLLSLRPVVLNMADACLGVQGENGEIPDGYDLKENKRIESRPWWAQAEALVGFLNAYSMTGDHRYFRGLERVWTFIKKHQKDNERGEWLWYSRLDKEQSPYKIGFWKAPYHNGRAMLEVCRRLRSIKARAA